MVDRLITQVLIEVEAPVTENPVLVSGICLEVEATPIEEEPPVETGARVQAIIIG